uniref:Mfs general substrate transporter n=2 Tax=Tetraselmis sp. GSL018 TaxID=582737 RepID=A0A061QN90_9CHLO
MSFNVWLVYIFSTLETASQSLRAGDVFSVYVLLLTGGRTDVVGAIQGVNGLTQLLCALPAGWLADRLRRDHVLKIAAVFGTAAGAIMAWALFTSKTVVWLGTGMVLLGAYKGLFNPPLEAIFADSVETGARRSAAYTTRYILQNLANCVGPVQSLIAFALLGNKWTVQDSRLVLKIGIIIIAAPLLLLLCFDDRKALGARSEALSSPSRNASTASLGGGGGAEPRWLAWANDPSVAVPLVITVSDLFAALASGMAAKFYVVFFVQACGMGPVYASVLGILGPISISACSALVNHLATRAGGDRMRLVLVTKALDFTMLAALALIPAGAATRDGLVALHLVRFGIANSSRPQLRSLMMDHVTKRHRGKWNALDGVRTVSWSGSAVIGGILIQNFGYSGTFLVSAAMKLLGWLVLLLLLPLLRKDAVPQCDEGSAADGLHAPLMATHEGDEDDGRQAERRGSEA